MKRLKAAWAWLRAHPWAFIAALFGALLAALGIQRKRLGRLQDELALARAKQRLAELRVTRDQISALEGAAADRVRALDVEIQEQRIRAAWAYEGGRELRGEALERELVRHGL